MREAEYTEAPRKSRIGEGANALTHGHVVGGVMTPTYGSWRAMVGRCTRPKNKDWDYYGGRGITICNRWRKFANFLEDMGERPEGRTLDRIDVDGNYELGNCRWATPLEQTINRRARAMTQQDSESQTAHTLRLMREEWEAPLRGWCEQLRVYSEVAADQLRRQNRIVSELRAEADRYRAALERIGRSEQFVAHSGKDAQMMARIAREALNGGTE